MNSITQDMKYRYSLIKYVGKHGVAQASHRCCRFVKHIGQRRKRAFVWARARQGDAWGGSWSRLPLENLSVNSRPLSVCTHSTFTPLRAKAATTFRRKSADE